MPMTVNWLLPTVNVCPIGFDVNSSLAVVAPLLRSPAGVYLRPLIGRVTGAASTLIARKRDVPAAP